MSMVGDQFAQRRGLIDRVRGILLTPNPEWGIIEAEPATIGGLYTGYVLILAAIGPVCHLIGSEVFGYGAFGIVYRPPLLFAVSSAVLSYVLSLVGVFVMALIIDALAPSFGGVPDRIRAFKVAAYSSTAAWLAGFFGIIPMLTILAIVGLYSFYLLYLGLPRLMRAPQDKALGYVIVTILATIVVYIIIAFLVGTVTMIGRIGTLGAMGALGAHTPGALTGTVNVPGAGSVDLAKLQAASQQLQAASQQAAGQAATGGTPGGGRAVQPVAGEVLQGLLPAAIGGYARSDVSNSTGGVAGLSGSSAEAHYARGGSTFTLQVTDMGGAAGLAGLMGAINVQSSKQTATGYEKIGKVDGRMTTEEWNGQSHNGKYGVMVADRFMVQAEGAGASIDDLKQAVGAVGFGRLEGLAHS